jgi:RNA-directed DNA polymerase
MELYFRNITYTRDMSNMSTVEIQIAERARAYPDEPLTNLHGYIDESWLDECLDALNKKGATGVDGKRGDQYNDVREERIPNLLTAFKSGRYRAPNIGAATFPKGMVSRRPLGLPTVEDKLLQRQ